MHRGRHASRWRADEPRRLRGRLPRLPEPSRGREGHGDDRVQDELLGPIRGGYVNAVSRALHKGKRTIVVDTELYDDDGKLVARVTQTQAVL